MDTLLPHDFRPPRLSAFPSRRTPAIRRPTGFTLLEVLIATTIFAIAMGVTMMAYVAVLKRSFHTESTIKGASELRYANDVISQAVRSACQTPSVAAGGLQLIVPPKDLGYATTQDITPLDTAGTKGTKANMRVLKLSNVAASAVVSSVYLPSAGRPAGALAASDIATYFKDSTSLPTIDLNDVFASGDTITIPATAFGPSVDRVINNISNNANNKTLTVTANFSVDIPSGTKIAASSGRRLLFSVESNGDLRYYPDNRDLTKFTVLARDIDPSPLSDPSNTSSTSTVPFTFTTATRSVALNLQKVPRGTNAGRTVQGVQTVVFSRTDPLIP